jgi:hypothetical protein
MAKSRVTTNPMYTGGAGGYSFYVRGGEQVIRQRKNNSNYGDGASRTRAQMIRRIRWGNLVNVFKSQKAWQPKAYDSKTKGQTDYNIFMSLNINQATVGFTKEMCEAGCAVIEGYQVSRGSLPPISLSPSESGNNYVTDIKISNAIQGGTTVGQLAADILANNSQFVEGDNIAFIFFKNWKTSRTEWPYAASDYTEITLDTSSTVVINSIPALDNRLSKSTGGFLQASWSSAGEFDPSREVGFVAIHTRKSASLLAVSSQEILMNSNSLVSQFSGAAWDEQCILSYGLSDEVPLDPSFLKASIQSVTANGSAVQGGVTLSGSQIVRITGKNLSPNSVRLYHNGILYTPLEAGSNYYEYLITQNGQVDIYANNSLYVSFSVDDIPVLDGFPCTIEVVQVPTTTMAFSQQGKENYKAFFNSYCANYNYMKNVDAPYFLLGWRADPFDQEDMVLHNCTVENFSSSSTITSVNVSVVDAEKPAWIEVNGVIIAVFNYN